MIKPLVVVIKPLVVLLALSASALGAPVFDNGPPNYVLGPVSYASDPEAGMLVADDFVLAQTTDLHAITFFGAFGLTGTAPPPDLFDVLFLADVGGQPGTTVIGGSSLVTAGRQATGVLIQGGTLPVYQFSASFTPFTALAGVPYWVTVIGRDVDPNDNFYWMTTLAGQGSPGHFFNGSVWAPVDNSPPNEFAFAFVPEPGSFSLLGLGLAGLVYRRRARARA